MSALWKQQVNTTYLIETKQGDGMHSTNVFISMSSFLTLFFDLIVAHFLQLNGEKADLANICPF